MKRYMITMMAMLLTVMNTFAMDYETARERAYYLTDKMAYELNLNDQQYNDAYEINLDYLLSLNTADDLSETSYYLTYRNADLRAILYDWQWTAFAAVDYLFRPVWWLNGGWYFPIFNRYAHGYYFYHRPRIFWDYRGGHGHHFYAHGFYGNRRPMWQGGMRGMNRDMVGHPNGHNGRRYGQPGGGVGYHFERNGRGNLGGAYRNGGRYGNNNNMHNRNNDGISNHNNGGNYDRNNGNGGMNNRNHGDVTSRDNGSMNGLSNNGMSDRQGSTYNNSRGGRTGGSYGSQSDAGRTTNRATLGTPVNRGSSNFRNSGTSGYRSGSSSSLRSSSRTTVTNRGTSSINRRNSYSGSSMSRGSSSMSRSYSGSSMSRGSSFGGSRGGGSMGGSRGGGSRGGR